MDSKQQETPSDNSQTRIVSDDHKTNAKQLKEQKKKDKKQTKELKKQKALEKQKQLQKEQASADPTQQNVQVIQINIKYIFIIISIKSIHKIFNFSHYFRPQRVRKPKPFV